MKDYTPRQLASIGKQFTFTMKPGGMARLSQANRQPVEWIPLPEWDVVHYRPRYYGAGIVVDYDPQTDAVSASFWLGYISIVTGPRSDFEFIRREEPDGGIDAFVK